MKITPDIINNHGIKPIKYLKIALDIDNSQTVMYFIYTRIIYTLVYILAIPHLRTLIWFLSLWFIAQMVINLI